VLVYLAWYFGEKIDRVVAYARHTEHGIAILLVIGVAIVAVRAYRRRRKLLAALATSPQDDGI
jgi:membrane protein DedA with SNARE-associated domain